MKIIVLIALAMLGACKVSDPPPIDKPFSDTFDRADIGGNYRPTSNAYRVDKGELKVTLAYNHPLWLKKKLPENGIL